MASKKQIPHVPSLRFPSVEVAEIGSTRAGDTGITANFPPLRRPDPKTGEAGTVRVGDTGISAIFAP